MAMISTIDIATQGYLESPLSVAADGYLVVSGAPIPVTPPGSGSGLGQKRYKLPPDLDQDWFRMQLEREDEEILAVIMAFMETKQ